MDIYSVIDAPLASHHYAVVAELGEELVTSLPKQCHHVHRKDWSFLRSTPMSNQFANYFEEIVTTEIHEDGHGSGDLNSKCAILNKAFQHAQDMVVPDIPAQARRPWISTSTLNLITARKESRAKADHREEQELQWKIKQSARRDRREWLKSLAGSGAWKDARKLRDGVSHPQGRLNDAEGVPISSECPADRFGQFLEDVQWARRSTSPFDDEPTHEPLPVNLGEVSMQELQDSAGAFK